MVTNDRKPFSARVTQAQLVINALSPYLTGNRAYVDDTLCGTYIYLVVPRHGKFPLETKFGVKITRTML